VQSPLDEIVLYFLYRSYRYIVVIVNFVLNEYERINDYNDVTIGTIGMLFKITRQRIIIF
jgi:hypothetical protein